MGKKGKGKRVHYVYIILGKSGNKIEDLGRYCVMCVQGICGRRVMGDKTNRITIGMEQSLEDPPTWQGEWSCATLKK